MKTAREYAAELKQAEADKKAAVAKMNAEDVSEQAQTPATKSKRTKSKK